MRRKLIRLTVSLAIFVGLSLILIFLTSESHSQPAAGDGQEHAHGDTEHDPGSHEGQLEEDSGHEDHASHEPLTLEDLAKIECEHSRPIVDCNDCRYEVGVAKINPIVADGLVQAFQVPAEQRVRNGLLLTGEVRLDLTRVVAIAPAGSGRVESIHRILGDTVQASETLAVIQSSEFGQAQANFLEVRAKLDLARQVYEREKNLSEQSISSQADFLVARNEFAAAQAALAAARKRLQLFGLSGEQIEAFTRTDLDGAFGQLTLTTSIAGTILEQNMVRGQLVSTAQNLYRIADLSRLWVWCDVYESDLAALYDRMASTEEVEAEIHVNAFPNEPFVGVVDMIGSQVDHATRTLKVRLIVDNPGGKLRPGMFVTAFVRLGECEPVVHVPSTAVLSDEQQHFVFVKLAEDLWIRRDITVGHRDKGMVEVLSGLAEGETIAAKGAFMFKSEVLKEKMGAGCAH